MPECLWARIQWAKGAGQGNLFKRQGQSIVEAKTRQLVKQTAPLIEVSPCPCACGACVVGLGGLLAWVTKTPISTFFWWQDQQGFFKCGFQSYDHQREEQEHFARLLSRLSTLRELPRRKNKAGECMVWSCGVSVGADWKRAIEKKQDHDRHVLLWWV